MSSSDHPPRPLPSRVVIAGAGFVGAGLATRLREAGCEVTLIVRTAESAARLSEAGFHAQALDIGCKEAVQTLTGELTEPETLILCASTRGGGEADYRHVYLEGTRNLLAQFPSARVIFTSSTSVYTRADGGDATEADPLAPTRPTTRLLLEAEALVLERGGCVLRLGGLYGATRWAARDRVLEGTATLGEDSDDLINLIHRSDAIAALFLLLETPTALGIYNATDGNPITRRELYHILAQFYGQPPAKPTLAAPQRRRGRSHKRVVCSRLTALGWEPTLPHIRAALESGE